MSKTCTCLASQINGRAILNCKYIIFHPITNLRELGYHIKWAYQRLFRGWDDRVAMGISWHLCQNMPAWIARMKQYGNSYPMDTTYEEWHEILDNIADGFRAGNRLLEDDFPVWHKLYDSGWDGEDIPNPDEFWKQWKKERNEAKDEFDEGMKLFVAWFFNLWD